ncbi:beta-1,3-galactosyltransferase 1-like [Bombyx mandarina]|uniref:Hexosyltransferase n=1 Tax=Bombyx mandarina TaxID=7092 RepID=A0A6J2KA66_BOMMA|nr:beta-1,3-galactosyltransferase 1-like [Bombyx mandarina]
MVGSRILPQQVFWKPVVRRRIFVILPFLLGLGVTIVACRWTAAVVSHVLLPPGPPDQNLEHFIRNRSLSHYFDNIQILIEPSAPCPGSDIPVVALVATTPSRFDQRQAIRETWAKRVPTYFFMGLEGGKIDESMVDIYVEAKEHSDMVILNFHEHYQNLTLKTGFMLKWTLERCANANFLLKIDDDVFLNPWNLEQVMRGKERHKLIGYKIKDSTVHRDQYTKWYLPRWLYSRDVIPEYLAGPAYVVNTKHIAEILQEAKKTPLINLEDVYFTYLVSREGLDFELTHERTFSPHKPFLLCSYWSLTTVHSVTDTEMLSAWKSYNDDAKQNSTLCGFRFPPLR